jgi:hypothetical protein
LSGRASCQSRRREDSDRFCGQRKSNRDRAGHEVLAGAAPADLPIYQSIAVEMIVNLRSAKSLGVTLPQSIVDQATTLIR